MDPIRDPEQNETQKLARIEALAGARVIEIGSGNGRLTWRYAPRARFVIGVDTEADVLGEARRASLEREQVRFSVVQGSAEALPFKAGSFDVVVFAWSL